MLKKLLDWQGFANVLVCCSEELKIELRCLFCFQSSLLGDLLG